MVNYSCDSCGKEFSQKSHYDSHKRRKTPCTKKLNKIELLESKVIELENKVNNSINIKDVTKKETINKVADTILVNEIINDKINLESNKIYQMDCNNYLDKLKKNSIDCIILDPPYFNVVNEKWDKQWKSLQEYLVWIENIIIKLDNCAKYSCSFWIFGYAYQLSFIIPIIEKYNFTYRQHIVLDKGLRSVAGRTSNKLKMFPTATEYIVYFHKESRPLLKKFLQNKQK